MPYANNNGVKIYYELEGNGPPLVLQHGFAGSLDYWHALGYVENLSKDYQLILVDARGCGASDKLYDLESYDLKIMASDLVTILNDLNIQKTHYLGYSMGGRIGFRAAMYFSQRFHSLILGGASFPRSEQNDIEDSVLNEIQKALTTALNTTPGKEMETYISGREQSYGPMLPQLRANMLRNDPQALMATIQAHRNIKSPPAQETLPKFTLPCLLYAGEADPRFLGAQECAHLIPGATFIAIPKLNHSEANAQSNQTLPHIRKFLAMVENSLPK